MFLGRHMHGGLLLAFLLISAWSGLSQEIITPGIDPAVEPSKDRLSTAPAKPTQQTVSYEDYIIGPEDLLEIRVFHVKDLDTTVRVGLTGSITLPLLGQLRASDLTPLELQFKITNRLAEKYVQNPQVTIFIKEYQNQPVSIIGAVESPGVYQLTTQKTLIEMLSLAGGLAKRNTTAAGRTVSITRLTGFGGLRPTKGLEVLGPDKIAINIRELLYTQREGLNIWIRPRDIISVSKADVVYVVGAVKRPGGFVLEVEEMVSVLQALAMAQGFGRYPAKGSARIIRRHEDGSRQEISIKLGKILKGKAEDPLLAANDILFVPSSKAKGGLMRGTEAAISVVSGLIIWNRR